MQSLSGAFHFIPERRDRRAGIKQKMEKEKEEKRENRGQGRPGNGRKAGTSDHLAGEAGVRIRLFREEVDGGLWYRRRVWQPAMPRGNKGVYA